MLYRVIETEIKLIPHSGYLSWVCFWVSSWVETSACSIVLDDERERLMMIMMMKGIFGEKGVCVSRSISTFFLVHIFSPSMLLSTGLA